MRYVPVCESLESRVTPAGLIPLKSGVVGPALAYERPPLNVDAAPVLQSFRIDPLRPSTGNLYWMEMTITYTADDPGNCSWKTWDDDYKVNPVPEMDQGGRGSQNGSLVVDVQCVRGEAGTIDCQIADVFGVESNIRQCYCSVPTS